MNKFFNSLLFGLVLLSTLVSAIPPNSDDFAFNSAGSWSRPLIKDRFDYNALHYGGKDKNEVHQLWTDLVKNKREISLENERVLPNVQFDACLSKKEVRNVKNKSVCLNAGTYFCEGYCSKFFVKKCMRDVKSRCNFLGFDYSQKV